MNADEQAQAKRLGRAWDTFVTAQDPHDISSEFLADIQFTQEVLAVPPPAPRVRAKIWQEASGRSLEVAISTASVVASPNGIAVHHEHAPATSRPSRGWRAVHTIFRLLAIGACAGFAAGFLAGIWIRLAMRVAGFLTIDRNRYLLTETEARVGEITLDGTMAVAMFVAIAGILGGVLYIAIRSVLPQSPLMRAGSYGFILLAVFGFILMDENNPDYQLFGPAWLNVVTFSLTYIVYGVLVSLMVEALDSRVAAMPWWVSVSWRTRLAAVALAPFGLFGMGAVAFVVVGVIGIDPVAIMMLLVLASPSVFRLAMRSSWLPQLPPILVARLGLSTVLVPGLFGVYLTMQGVVGILTG